MTPPPPDGPSDSADQPDVGDGLTSPRPSDRASGPGDTRTSDVGRDSFRNGDSSGDLQAEGRDHAQLHDKQAPQAATHNPQVPLSESDSIRAERKVASLFLLAVLGVVGFVVTFFAVEQQFGESGNVYFTPLLGVFMALALGGIGAGTVLWAKLLMVDEESVQQRHPFGSKPEERAATAQALKQGIADSGLPRRKLLRNSLLLGAGSLALLPLPFVGFLGKFQHKERILATTSWREGVRLIRQNGTPVRLGDLQIGGVESVYPDVEQGTRKADSPALLIRMRPDELKLEGEQQQWAYQGHVVYSSICTHLGCPVKLYEQQTHHLLCPCHQSTFDASQGAKVIFGPAARALPQLPIFVDDEGYFIAASDFEEPVGPSYWERG
ncbi:MAG: cytochrome bc1 complex Rieske iron-sulfur subunit [Mycobacteriales bacterium]